MTDLAGRTALVTGGASGIGEACARELAERGALVTVADRDDVAAKAVAEDIGGKAWAVDLSDVSALGEFSRAGLADAARTARHQRSAPCEVGHTTPAFASSSRSASSIDFRSMPFVSRINSAATSVITAAAAR